MRLCSPYLTMVLTGLALGAQLGACGQPSPGRATTRFCPDDGTEDLCHRHCAELGSLECTATDADGESVPECAKDGATGDYLRIDDAYVVPPGGTRCFAALSDADGETESTADDVPSSCVDDGANLGYVLVGTAEDDPCIDIQCGLSSDPGSDCPDL